MSKKLGIATLILSVIAIALSCFALLTLHNAQSATEPSPESIQYVIYLGTNDKDTKEPVFSAKEAKSRAKSILINHFGGYTIQDADGGWIDNGMIFQEYTLIIYLSDTTPDEVHAAADEMLQTFKQSSVLIQANQTSTEYYSGK